MRRPDVVALATSLRCFDLCAPDEDSTAAKGEKRKRDVDDDGEEDEDD